MEEKGQPLCDKLLHFYYSTAFAGVRLVAQQASWFRAIRLIPQEMAEDAVPCELFSAKFPAIREKYREFLAIPAGHSELKAHGRVLWQANMLHRDELEQGTIREQSGKEQGMRIP